MGTVLVVIGYVVGFCVVAVLIAAAANGARWPGVLTTVATEALFVFWGFRDGNPLAAIVWGPVLSLGVNAVFWGLVLAIFWPHGSKPEDAPPPYPGGGAVGYWHLHSQDPNAPIVFRDQGPPPGPPF